MLVVPVKAGGAQFVGHSGEYGLAKVVGPKLADKGQAGRCEEHLLPHFGKVGHVRDGCEVWSLIMAF